MLSKQTACVVAFAAVLMTPALGAAQQAGSVAGVVRDTTGAVLPGVTVEASSPALIEKVRAVTTDQTGQYKIVDLRPGTYMVTFTMTGFSAVRREGIDLSAGFTATINADLRIGEVAETITVSGQSPIVDVQNVTQSRVMTREVLDSIPSGKQFTALASLVPGVTITGSNGALTQDVGGMSGMAFAMATIHGGKQDDQTVHINGMSVASLTSIGNSRTNIQDGNVEEYSMQLASQAAEFAYGGIYVNVIPKEGGNGYRGALFASGTASGLQANNLDDDLVQRGLKFPNQVKKLIDINPSFGGPLKRDKLWFYAAARYLNTEGYIGGLYYNAAPTSWIYTPDLTRKAINDQKGKNESLNLTWQALPKHKLTMFYNTELQCYCHFGISPNLSPEATLYMQSNNRMYQGTWSSPITNRLLVDAGFSYYWNDLPRDVQPDSTQPAITNSSTGLTYRGGGQVRNPQTIDYLRASVSYVTGAHALKAGFSYMYAYGNDFTFRTNGNLSYTVLNGPNGTVVPSSVSFFTTPYSNLYHLKPASIFAQDQWKVARLTVNAGLRFDMLSSSYSGSNVPPTQYLPVARVYNGADVLNWKDLSPRLGVAYDLFGNGKTAIKASVSRYVLQEGKGNTTALDPVLAATNSITRTWNDVNHDFVLQGDPLNPALNDELGPSLNNNFGKPTSTLRFDPAWASGFGVRPYQWETSVSVQHEIVPGLSANAAYFRRLYGNFIATYNEAVTPADYDPYCITAPADPRLPNGGGNQICGLFDLNPAKLGQVSNVRTLASNFGSQKDHWNGFDLTLNARLKQGLLLQGGLSTGKYMADNCDVWRNNPHVGDAVFTSATSPALPTSAGTSSASGAAAQFCHQETPFLTQVKFLGSYPLPWGGLQVSGAFQSIVPDPTQGQAFTPMGLPANYLATNAVFAPSLGRNLSAGPTGVVTVNVAEPGSVYAPRASQIDLRVTRTFTFARVKVQPLVDFFNVLNANPVFQFNSAYGTTGSSWMVPQSLMPGRLIRLGGQINF
jgi:hypothetical protein